jgi:hypothetical protein
LGVEDDFNGMTIRIAFSEVEEHVPNGPSWAVHQFGVVMGRELKMHPPEDVWSGDRVELFVQIESESKMGEGGSREGFDEGTAKIAMGGGWMRKVEGRGSPRICMVR